MNLNSIINAYTHCTHTLVFAFGSKLAARLAGGIYFSFIMVAVVTF